MKQVKYPDGFLKIIQDILDNEEFQKLKQYTHHNYNRYDHSLRVAYKTYKITKRRKLNYISATRGALLHDFFFVDTTKLETKRAKIKCLNNHPHEALNNSLKHFNLNDIEKNIILSHMAPFGKTLPKYKESIIVNWCDDKVAINELYAHQRQLISVLTTFIAILIINFFSNIF